MTREFTTETGEVLVYDPASIPITAVQAAHSIYTLYNERIYHLPETGAQRALFEQDNTNARALAHLLRRRDGKRLIPYDVAAAQTEILDMVSSLPFSEWSRLMEVRADFFTRAKLRDAVSTSRLASLLPVLTKLYSSEEIAAPQSDADSERSSSSVSTDSTTSTNPTGD